MKTMIKNNQRGYSIGELAIVISIICVLVAGSIMGVQVVLRSNNVNRITVQTNKAVDRIVSRLLRETNYASAGLKTLTSPGLEIWDNQFIQNAGTDYAEVRHVLGGNIFVRPLSAKEAGVDANQGFVYTLTGISKAACSDLAVGLQPMALSMGIRNGPDIANVPNAGNTLSVPPGYTKVKDPGLPFSSATVIKACDGTSSSTTISLLIPRR